MRTVRLLALASLLLVVQAPALSSGPGSFQNANAITTNRLYAHLQFIASDELEGRDTPSRGLNAASKYIASQLMQWGLKPMGDDGTFFQKIPLTNPTVDSASTKLNLGAGDLKYGDDFYASTDAGSVSAGLVYLPTAWEKLDDKDDPYLKVDVKDKIILAVQGRPEGVSFRDIRAGKVLTPQAAAVKHGAKGLIFVFTDAGDWATSVAASTTGSVARPASNTPQTANPPSVIVKPEALGGLLQGEPMNVTDLQARIKSGKYGDAFALQPSKSVSMDVKVTPNIVYTQNVVGAVVGTDPKLSAEYVAVGAHYDHLGMRRSGSGDLIFNGADDDGSGTVSILEIAHAFATGPKPKRSILFVWHCGEEKGLWGSGYFTEHPTVPITSIVAQLNIDMIGRTKKPGDTSSANKVLTLPNGIYIVGTTRMSSELGAEAKAVNDRYYKLKYDFTYDDLNNPERIFFRSDHYNYAVHGIPVLFWFDGVHEDYHRVSDEVQKIDFPQMEKVARTVYATAWDVANRKTRPKVDMPLPVGQ